MKVLNLNLHIIVVYGKLSILSEITWFCPRSQHAVISLARDPKEESYIWRLCGRFWPDPARRLP